ncbi:Os10g0108750, partial [Oryza sativa Japonica Group]
AAAGHLELLRYPLLGAPYDVYNVVDVGVRHRAALRHGHVHRAAVSVVPVLGSEILSRIHREEQYGGGLRIFHHRPGTALPKHGGDSLEHGDVVVGSSSSESDVVDQARRDGDVVEGVVDGCLVAGAGHKLINGHGEGRYGLGGVVVVV